MSHPNGETHAEREERLRDLRHTGLHDFSWPEIEPLASRLERAARVNECKHQTWDMLEALNARGGWAVCPDVWVKGVCVPFLVYGWKGAFLVWSVDYRWTLRQATMVMPARDQIQRELGSRWSGQAEAIFHSPREPTGFERQLLVDEEAERPVDIVVVGGRIDQVVADCSTSTGAARYATLSTSFAGRSATAGRWSFAAAGGDRASALRIAPSGLSAMP